MSQKAKQKTHPTLDNIEFLEHHYPPIQAGNYKITATQTVSSTLKNDSTTHNKQGSVEQRTITGTDGTTFSTAQTFSIAGERFKLKPQEFLSVFPPEGSAGDHAYVMPHLILSRSTLPWERTGKLNDETVPWLGLLLFDMAEAPKPQIVSYEDLFKSGSAQTKKVSYVDLDHEVNDLLNAHGQERVTIIDVPSELAQIIIPTAAELKLLTHVRQWLEPNGAADGVEKAVCIGNRLPARGRTSVVHLVSFENRFDDKGKFVFDGALPVRFVSFKSWRFSVLDEESYKLTEAGYLKLKDLVKDKTMTTAQLNNLKDPRLQAEIVGSEPFLAAVGEVLGSRSRLLDKSGVKLRLLKIARYKKLTFKSLLLELDRQPLALPASPAADKKQNLTDVQKSAEMYRSRGYIPLPHHMRNGQDAISWYHGPLRSGSIADVQQILPVQSADQLLRWDKAYGMFDVSYAAAWELGRLLTLQNKRVSTELFKWKRAHSQHEAEIATLQNRFDHLPFRPIIENLEFPKIVADWFSDLSLLKGIPFNYLIPDMRMLPIESIRFFQFDRFWIECLLDGAFSIGRLSTYDLNQDEQRLKNLPDTHALKTAKTIAERSGFIVRSDVVSGWPNFQVVGYHDSISLSANATMLKKASTEPIRQDHLSANTLLVLFDGVIKSADIHKKPEVLHFGVSEPDDVNTKPYKRLRGLDDGVETDATIGADFKRVDDYENRSFRIIDVEPMARDLKKAIEQSLKEKIATIEQDKKLSAEQQAAKLKELKGLQIGRKKLSSAGFALQMIEGVERVRFST